MFFSKSNYENMTIGTNDDDAMIYTIASNQVNAIQALKATRTLIVMTTGGEYQYHLELLKMQSHQLTLILENNLTTDLLVLMLYQLETQQNFTKKIKKKKLES